MCLIAPREERPDGGEGGQLVFQPRDLSGELFQRGDEWRELGGTLRVEPLSEFGLPAPKLSSQGGRGVEVDGRAGDDLVA
ncbi:hypothetical protein [Streptomyces sp. NPDC017868]|uniref:hypothetical protein n=1 Tax=Streptomyces sp. NPDC017868 TaxID=3365014 RepID=UPI00379F2FE1